MALNNPYDIYKKVALNPQPAGESENNNVQPAKIQPVSPRPSTAQVAGGAEAYRNNSIMTATPEELTLMLYDGALRFMNQAIVHMIGKRVEPAHNSLIRTQEIFAELRDTLNMEVEISNNLYALYTFMIELLIKANLEKNPEPVRQVITLTRDLRDTWAQAIQLVRQGSQEQASS